MERYQLSSQQTALWASQGDVACQLSIELSRDISPSQLQESLNFVVENNENFSTVMAQVAGVAVPFQTVTEDALVWQDSDLLPQGLGFADFVALCQQSSREFYLSQDKPIVGCYSVYDDQRAILIITCSGLNADEYSLRQLYASLVDSYVLVSKGEQPQFDEEALQYIDYSEWTNELSEQEDNQAASLYWQQQLINTLTSQQNDGVALFKRLQSKSQQEAVGSKLSVELPSQLLAGVIKLAGDGQTQLENVLLSCWSILLSRVVEQNQVGIDVLMAGRDDEQLENTLGLIDCFVPFDTQVDSEQSFVNFLTNVEQASAKARQLLHFFNPFEQAKSASQLHNHKGLEFQFAFNQNTGSSGLTDGFKLLALESDNSGFSLSLKANFYTQTQQLKLVLDYDGSLIAPSACQLLLEYYVELLTQCVASPNVAVKQLSLLNVQKQQSQVDLLNRAHQSSNAKESVVALIDACAEQFESKTALIQGDRQYSYGQLKQLTDSFAARLIESGVTANEVVAIYADRQLEYLISLLAVLKAGGVYLPLDPAYPAMRTEHMLADSQAKWVLASGKYSSRFDLPSITCLNIDNVGDVGSSASEKAANLPQVTLSVEHGAYLMYTSGSTGVPKGVLMSHQAISNHIKAAVKRFEINSEDRVFISSPFCFDPSIEQVLTSLTSGATAVLKADDPWSTATISAMIESHQLTVVNFPTGFAKLLVADWASGDMNKAESLRLLIAGGDQLPAHTVEQWSSLNQNDALLINAYGPTEAAVTSTTAAVTNSSINLAGDVTIGQALNNRKIFVVDAGLNQVPPGYAGELFIGGDCLASGYWQKDELTAESFTKVNIAGQSSTLVYRTGDQVYFDEHGDVYFCGRKDAQLKFRGFRVEPAEVEYCVSHTPGIVDTYVAVIKGDGTSSSSSETLLVVYFVAEPSVNTEKLTATLEQKLPAHMWPSHYVQLEHLPLMPNGKVDKKRMGDISYFNDVAGGVPLVEPTSETEKVLVDMCRNLLGTEQFGTKHNFFNAGGHSLVAMRCLSRVRQHFGIDMSIKAFYQCDDIGELAGFIDKLLEQQENEQALPPITKVSRDEPLVLSYAQQRLVFLDHLQRGSSQFNMQAMYRLTGKVCLSTVKKVFEHLLERHEVLRTCFTLEAGEYRQQINNNVTLPWVQHDFSHLDAKQQQTVLQQLGEEDLQQSFDLSQDAMLRVNVLQMADDEAAMIVTLHHIVADGWSVQLLGKEFSQLYSDLVNDKELSVCQPKLQYADYAHWQRRFIDGERLAKQIDFWLTQLSDAPQVHQLPLDMPRPTRQSYAGNAIERIIDEKVTKGLTQYEKRQGVTSYMALHSALAIVLGRYSGQSDMVIGTVMSGRDQLDVEDMFGIFINTLALRTQADDNQTVNDFSAHVKQVVLDGFANKDVPFDKLVEELNPSRSLNYSPVIQILLVLQNHQTTAIELDGVKCERLENSTLSSKYDLTVNVVPVDDKLQITWQYNTAIFNASTVGRFADSFTQVLNYLVNLAQEDDKLGDINMLTEADSQWLEQRNGVKSYPWRGRLEQLIAEQSDLQGDKAAIICDGQSLTYAQLERQASNLAHHLLSLGVQAGQSVALYIPRSTQAIVAVVAVLKVGAVYVPLDPQSPAKRVDYIVEDAGVKVVLTHSQYAAQISTDGINCICIDDEHIQNLMLQSTNLPLPDISKVLPYDQQQAYMIYTSGSTGKPKGVVEGHYQVTRLLDSANEVYQFSADDVWMQFHSIAFDVSVWEIFGALTCGATLVVPNQQTVRDCEVLCDLIEQHKVTILSQTPSAFYPLLSVLHQKQTLFSLRHVVFGGEALNFTKLLPWFEIAGHQNASLVNMYGITETTVHLTHKTVNQADCQQGMSLIGVPLADSSIQLCNDHCQLQPIGAIGEIVVGGPSVAFGYYNRPELTAERFVEAPFSQQNDLQPDSEQSSLWYRSGDLARWLDNGELEYLGRKDQQVKIRGFRVEPGEVENHLMAIDSVGNCVVLAQDDDIQGQRLVAYLCPENPEQSHQDIVSECQNTLKGFLADYMQPSQYCFINQIPMTNNGKVDKPNLINLAETFSFQQVDEREKTQQQQLLADIWCNLLGLESVGLDDNFFELGGHSLLVTHLKGAIEKQFNLNVNLMALFDCPTIATQGQMIGEINDPLTQITKASRSEALPLTFEQKQLWLFEQMEQQTTGVFNNVMPVHLRGRLDSQLLMASLNRVQMRHESLRTTYVMQQGQNGQQVCQKIHPQALFDTVIEQAEGLDEQAILEKIAQVVASEQSHSFDLAQGPLMRVTLVKFAPLHHVLVINLHHINVDGWSLNLLLKETLYFYRRLSGESLPALPALEVQCADFALWQQQFIDSNSFETDMGYWQQKLQDAPKISELKPDFARGADIGHQGEIHKVNLDAELTEKIENFSRERQTTAFVTLLNAFNLMLFIATEQDDLVVGTDVANRSNVQTQDIIGFLVNQLPLRNTIDVNASIESQLMATRENTLAAIAHQHIPFEMIVKKLGVERSGGYSPLFQTKFYLLEGAVQGGQYGPLELETIELDNKSARLDFTLALAKYSDGIRGSFVYNKGLYRAERVALLAKNYAMIVEQMLDNPQQTVAQLQAKVNDSNKQVVGQKRSRAALDKIKSFSRTKPQVSVEPAQAPFAQREFGITVSADSQKHVDAVMAKDRSYWLDLLQQHGAVLLRGFNVTTPEQFDSVSRHILQTPHLSNTEHNPVNTELVVQTPVDYAKDQTLLWHNENTFNHKWPAQILFNCSVPAVKGGQTPLVDTARLYQLMPDDIRQQFVDKGVMYVRRYGKGDELGLGWQTIFNTTDKQEVEAKCQAEHMSFEWHEDDSLTTRAVRPACVFDEHNQTHYWLNQILHWHFSCLPEQMRSALQKIYTPEQYPRQCHFGDGSVIDDQVVAKIHQLYQQCEYHFDWQSGDVLLVDNARVAHGRKSFEGERTLFVAMGNLREF